MLVIAASPIPGVYTSSVQRTPNQTDSDVTCSRSCDQVKITKKGLKDNELKNPGFEKEQFTCFVFLSVFLLCF